MSENIKTADAVKTTPELTVGRVEFQPNTNAAVPINNAKTPEVPKIDETANTIKAGTINPETIEEIVLYAKEQIDILMTETRGAAPGEFDITVLKLQFAAIDKLLDTAQSMSYSLIPKK